MDKAALFAPRLPEEDFEVPGVGTVRVRALTRAEALKIANQNMPVDQIERYLLACALVEPKLTENEVRQWQDVAPAGEIEPICKAIQRLSGLEEAADKAAYKSVRDEQ